MPILVKSILAFSLFSIQTFADTTDCVRISEKKGSIQVQRFPSADGNTCYVSIRNHKNFDPRYRSYLFTSSGRFMIFNSFGAGSESRMTGAREFYLFPRKAKAPKYRWNDVDRRLIVSTTSDHEIYFDYEDAEVLAMSGATLRRSPNISPNNNGGVEIENFNGLLLDLGFKTGSSPSSFPDRTAQLLDLRNRTCRIKNKDIFKYGSGEPSLKYSDSELKIFVKKHCPLLEI
ncbi:hypothetical protein [Bdellovibrio bacteriovorus]|uniref:hypothetical protein n=1 Tax=Bdellovibrio bacteriovorus TaxID=959 RepID=UPI0005A1AF79|nr:hypothetical protein [Bdellovibrio bacteriovorus]